MSDAEARTLTDGIAVIGMAGRFPGARNIDEFWQNLVNARESISFFSDDELLAEGADPALLSNPNYVKARGILGDTDRFAASFFGFSPRVAELMDPQHRIFLECAWEALEHAGYNSNTYPGRIGVYAGESMNTYLLNNLYAHLDLVASAQGLQAAIGNDKDSLTTEVSYRLNLKGPGVTVQTSSSTSLSAVHVACQSVLNYECDMALAGGISIHFPEKAGYLHHEGGPTSLDGHCRAFDARANGFVSGHGVGLVVLKRLADAIEDRDTIYAVIRGSAMNNDGSQKVSYMAPSVEGQVEVVALAQAIAGVEPESISYIEAHGTATALGDPIEVAALTQVFQASSNKRQFCALGSVKTNIGHLDSAAGVAGLIKTVLALHHGLIPPSLHYQSPNPQIDFANSPFYVNTQLSKWPENGHPRRAGVTSLGMGGTNAHVILEEAPPREPAAPSRPWQLLLLSARSASALEQATDQLAAHLLQNPELGLPDLAYTLQVGRWGFEHRRALVCQDLESAARRLALRDPDWLWTDQQEPGARSLAMLFPGQGAQYPNMGRELYEQEPLFREQVDQCCELLKPHLGLNLRELIYPAQQQLASAAEQLQQTWLTQPALFVIEYAMARLWLAWGLNIQAMIGHSIGEYVAACLAGVMHLEDALRLVALRGRLMQATASGAMLSVALSEDQLLPWLSPGLDLAVSNAPESHVLAGPLAAIEALQQRLQEAGIQCRRLHTSHAFHSALMEPVLAEFAAQLRTIHLQPPVLPYISNVTGSWITAEQATDPNYWVRHLRQTVRFAEGLQTLLQEPERVLLEVGPGQTLTDLARRQLNRGSRQALVSSLRHPQSNISDQAFLLSSIGKLWLAGVELDWNAFYAQERRQRLALPSYPFERARYWIEPRPRQPAAPEPPATRLTQRPDPADWFYVPNWQRSLAPAPTTPEPHNWLIFADQHGIASTLAQRLRQQNQQVILVNPGRSFATEREQSYQLNPQQAADYRELLAELHGRGSFPQRVLYAWGLNQETNAAEELQPFYGLLWLAQALGAQQNHSVHLELLSSQLQSVSGNEATTPQRAALLGLCKVIPQEYPHLTCRSIDLQLPDHADWRWSRMLDQLLAELAQPAAVAMLAYRNGQRWTQRFDALRLPAPGGTPRRLRQRGVYLITGGLGGIGAVLAGYLARTLQARLGLLGRSSLPPREQWQAWLAEHPATEAMARRIRLVQELEAAGAEVLLLQADVAERSQLQAALDQLFRRFGELHGVIHAAGAAHIQAFQAIQELDREQVQIHFGPKLAGLAVLEELLRGRQLDFGLLFSSLAAVLGGLGMGAYAAANFGLDSAAHRLQHYSPLAWSSINWDAWRLGDERDQRIGATLADLALSPEQGIAVFERLLEAEPLPQIVVSTADLQARMAQWLSTPEPQTLATPDTGAAVPALHARPQLQTAYAAARNPIEERLVRLWQHALGVEPVGVYDNFFDLGGTSLSGLQLIEQVRKEFNINLPAVSLYEGPTISALARLIQPEQGSDTAYEEQRSRGERRRERRQRRREAQAGDGDGDAPEIE